MLFRSVAMRLICEREQERDAFRAEEYWSIAVVLSGTNPPPFEAKLHSINGQDASIATETDAQRIVEQRQAAAAAASHSQPVSGALRLLLA